MRVCAFCRDKIVLASKVGNKMGDGPEESGLSRSAIVRQVEASLRRLQTDYLDLYYLHQPDYNTPHQESLETIESLVRQGKVRCVGTSNFASWQHCRLLWLAENRGARPASVAQPMYNLISRGIEQEFVPMCREFGVSIVAYNPLAGGLLTGKQTSKTPLAGTRFAQNAGYRDRYWHERERRLRDGVEIPTDVYAELVTLAGRA